MRFFALFILFCVGFVLSGCASHSRTYLNKGGEIAPLVVPPGVPMIKQGNYYPIPAVANEVNDKVVSLKPPTL